MSRVFMVFAASGENLFETRYGAKDFFDNLEKAPFKRGFLFVSGGAILAGYQSIRIRLKSVHFASLAQKGKERDRSSVSKCLILQKTRLFTLFCIFKEYIFCLRGQLFVEPEAQPVKLFCAFWLIDMMIC